MILYKSADESRLATDTEFDSDVKTLPRKARRDLVLKLRKHEKRRGKLAAIFPELDIIPEDGESDGYHLRRLPLDALDGRAALGGLGYVYASVKSPCQNRSEPSVKFRVVLRIK